MSASVSHNQTGTSQIFHRIAWWNPKNHVRNEREQTVFNPAEKHVCCGNKSKVFVSYFYYKYLWNTFTYFCKPCWFSSQLNMIYGKKNKKQTEESKRAKNYFEHLKKYVSLFQQHLLRLATDWLVFHYNPLVSNVHGCCHMHPSIPLPLYRRQMLQNRWTSRQ